MTWNRLLPPLGPLVVFATALLLFRLPSDDPMTPAGGSADSDLSRLRSKSIEVADLSQGALASAPFNLDQRPLFERGRRQPVPVEATASGDSPEQTAAEQAPTDSPEGVPAAHIALRLAGILRSGDQKMALVQIEDNDHEDWLKLGETVGGWTITAIDASSIRLESGGQVQTVQLYPP